MQLFVTYIVLFVTAVKARFSDFYFFIADPTQDDHENRLRTPALL